MSQPLRIGLIGLGRWGKIYIRTLLSLSDRCRLTHLGTRDARNADLVPYPVTVTADWRDVIRSDCDVVVIVTPAATHAQLLEACLDAGKPCMVEKPLCLDVATAQRLHERVQASGVPVLVNHTQLFHAGYRALKEAVEAAGEPVRLIVGEGLGYGPFRDDVSALWDWGPHDVSLCLDLLRQPPDFGDAFGGPVSPHGWPELVTLRLQFPDGTCAWLQICCLAPRKARTLSVFTDSRLYRLDDSAPSPLSVAHVDLPNRYTVKSPGVPEPMPIAVTSDGPALTNAVRYFLEGVAGGDQSAFGTSLALEVTRVLAACEAALQSRQALATTGHGGRAS